jgi:Cu2+-containing amine oxidase
MSVAGAVVWPSAADPIWRFDWRLADAPDQEGVVITNVRYRGTLMLYKGSLPSLRVHYDGPCGPYKDPLTFNNAQATTRCPGSRVCTYTYTAGGKRALGVESYHRIGAYRLTHRWVFWEDGWLLARLYSAGLQCNFNHRHHAYWRFDFDIGDASNDLLLEHNTYTGNIGYGTGWSPMNTEATRLKNPPSQRRWAVMDTQTGRGFQLIPGNDGTADAFSSSDLWLLRYHGTEDRHGQQGNAWGDALGPYVDGEAVNGTDLVVWYCGHLAHEAAHGGDDWHSTGPNLSPFGGW